MTRPSAIAGGRGSSARRTGKLLGRVAVCTLLTLCVILQGPPGPRAQVHPRYHEGDWFSVTSVRFVNSAVATPEFIYFGTEGGVARYDRHDERWLPAMTTAEGLPSNEVNRMAYDPMTDEVYAETFLGAAVYLRVLKEWRPVSEFPGSLVQDWDAVDLMQYQLPFGYDALEAGLLTDPHLRSYTIRGALEDSWGTLWVGTWGEFVWRRAPGGYEIEPEHWGLYHDNVEAIFLDGAVIYFGGMNYYNGDGGLSIYDTAAGRWEYAESRFTSGFASDRIREFAGQPGARYLWMATDDGLVRLDRGTQRYRSYNRRDGLSDQRINALCLDGDILWIGTETGVDGIYLPGDSVFSATTEAVNNARVYAIAVTGDVVWLGTDRGLFRLAKPVPEWQSFSAGAGPTAGNVRALAHDDRYLYVGSDRGIAVIDLVGSEGIAIYESPSFLRDDNVYDLAVTDSIVWAATPSGLVRFVPDTREQRIFTTDDGLVELPVQAIVVDGDYLWLGTPGGASRFRWFNPLRID
ncbi:MAG TPA: two-component regulator propeller domain-containing protein [Acidobacteriota bacterium]|nr:two-component regulator propeller domain-containing protein [Acidobacteriota bacterium]